MDCGVRACVGWVSELKTDDGRTVSIEKLCLSLLNLNKVIKVSYLYQESRKRFVFFGFLSVWTFYAYEHYERFYISVYFTYWYMGMLHQNFKIFFSNNWNCISRQSQSNLEKIRFYLVLWNKKNKIMYKKIKYFDTFVTNEYLLSFDTKCNTSSCFVVVFFFFSSNMDTHMTFIWWIIQKFRRLLQILLQGLGCSPVRIPFEVKDTFSLACRILCH